MKNRIEEKIVIELFTKPSELKGVGDFYHGKISRHFDNGVVDSMLFRKSLRSSLVKQVNEYLKEWIKGAKNK